MTETIWQWLNHAGNEASALSQWELIAVMLALAYLALAMRASNWCWFAAFISTAIYTVLFWQVALLMESLLNIYYMVMAIYGYYQWRGGAKTQARSFCCWRLAVHVKFIGFTMLISLIVGYIMATHTQAAYPYIDAATTCFAVMTTYLMTQKVVENWLYWIVIDLVSIYLYFNKGLMLTSLLFAFYVVLAVIGYIRWQSGFKSQQLELAKCTN